MRDAAFYKSAGKSFAHKLKVMSRSEANIRSKETLEMAIEDRKKKIPEEFLDSFLKGLEEG